MDHGVALSFCLPLFSGDGCFLQLVSLGRSFVGLFDGNTMNVRHEQLRGSFGALGS